MSDFSMADAIKMKIIAAMSEDTAEGRAVADAMTVFVDKMYSVQADDLLHMAKEASVANDPEAEKIFRDWAKGIATSRVSSLSRRR